MTSKENKKLANRAANEIGKASEELQRALFLLRQGPEPIVLAGEDEAKFFQRHDDIN